MRDRLRVSGERDCMRVSGERDCMRVSGEIERKRLRLYESEREREIVES